MSTGLFFFVLDVILAMTVPFFFAWATSWCKYYNLHLEIEETVFLCLRIRKLYQEREEKGTDENYFWTGSREIEKRKFKKKRRK